MRKLVLSALLLVLFLAPVTAQENTFNASFDTYYAGQTRDAPSFQLDNVLPGDSGLWVVDISLNDTYSLYIKLNETDDSDNSCIEPEADAEGGSCDPDGELDEEMNFTAWIESTGGNLQHDPGEKLLIVNNWTQMSNPWSFLGDLSPSDEKRIVVKWLLPKGATNAAQTDSFGFDLVAATGEPSGDDSNGGGDNGSDDNGNNGDDETSTSDGTNNFRIESSGTSKDSSDSDNVDIGILEVTVTNESGTAIEGATVEVSGDSFETSGDTNASGIARFSLAEGDYLVNASVSGYIFETADQEITADETSSLSFSLELMTGEESEQEQPDQESPQSPETPETPTPSFFQSQSGLLALLLLILLAVLYWRRRDIIERFNLPR